MPAPYTPNAKLRAARERRNWTLDDVARKLRALMVSHGETQVGVVYQHVYRWERGTRRPGMRHRHYLCLLFDLEPEQLGFLPSDYAEPNLVNQSGQPPPWGGIGRPLKLACTEEELVALNLSRRKLLAASGLLGAAIGAETTAEAVAKVTEPLDRGARVASGRVAADDPLIADLNAFTDAFQRAYPTVGNLLVEPLRAHIDVIRAVLKQPLLPAQREALLRTASQAASLMASMQLFNLGDRAAARSWLAESIGFGEATNDSSIHVLGLIRAAELYTYSGQADKSVRLLGQARRLAERTCSPNAISWILVNQAEAHATARSPKEVPQLLDLAAEVQQRSRPGYEPSWAESWGAANVAGYAGTVYTLLERPGPARAVLQQALAELEPSESRRRSVCLVNLATAFAQELEVEAACELARKAVEVAGPMFSGTVVERMVGLRRRLARWPKVRAVKELDERLRSVGTA